MLFNPSIIFDATEIAVNKDDTLPVFIVNILMRKTDNKHKTQINTDYHVTEW